MLTSIETQYQSCEKNKNYQSVDHELPDTIFLLIIIN